MPLSGLLLLPTSHYNHYVLVSIGRLDQVLGNFVAHTQSFSCVQLFATLQTVAHQAPLSMGFSRQKNTGVGCHFLLQGTFPD